MNDTSNVPSKLTVLWVADSPIEGDDDGEVVSAGELRTRLLKAWVWPYLFRYRRVDVVTNCWGAMPCPLLAACVARAICRGRVRILDHYGVKRRLSILLLMTLLAAGIRDYFLRVSMRHRLRRELARLSKPAVAPLGLQLSATPFYFRTDLVFQLSAGGSVGHIAGVLNNLKQFGGPPVFLTTDRIPTVDSEIETYTIPMTPRFRDFRELADLDANRLCRQAARQACNGRAVSFVYQRYSLLNYAGLHFARDLAVPFVLEYNGSEVWKSRNWGRALKHEKLAEKVELLNVATADVVVVVSQPMLDELVMRGVDASRVLVNPNGVNPRMYSPEVDGAAVRQKYDLMGKTVIGFIGTFGPWHGAEVLAEAFGRLIARRPEYRQHVRLLMIGGGARLPLVEETLRRHDVAELSILTGQVAQSEGPMHLAACDILSSPHVPNPDGTRFFGSPTKLFEYMAMGRGIVASNLDQIGDILEHDQTAWLVRPGDPGEFADGLRVLIDDASRRELLGQAARQDVVARFTWREHTRRIIDKLKERAS